MSKPPTSKTLSQIFCNFKTDCIRDVCSCQIQGPFVLKSVGSVALNFVKIIQLCKLKNIRGIFNKINKIFFQVNFKQISITYK